MDWLNTKELEGRINGWSQRKVEGTLPDHTGEKDIYKQI